MGILDGPRINFWGGIQTNVCTTNNSNEIGGKTLIDLARATVTSSESDEDLIKFIRDPSFVKDPNTKESKEYFTNGGWNYYGDHQVNFVDAAVSSEGEAGGITETGDLVGEPVYLLDSLDPKTGQGPFFGPVMVDLDPTSSSTTQIFVGGLQIGRGENLKLLIRHDTVCSSRALGRRLQNGETDSPGSSFISAIFQLAFPKSSVKSYDAKCKTIAAIMKDPAADGFVLRFSMFEMAPYLTTPELLDAYEKNENPSNPSSGRVIGALGPLYAGEPETCPPGRMLVNTSAGGPNPAGFAILNPRKALLSIDMSTLMQKASFRDDRKNFTGPIGPNIDFGPISVLTGSARKPTGIAFDAQPADYYKYGGIVDIPVTTEQFKAMDIAPLTLTGSKSGNDVTIEEQPLRIYGNARNIYMSDQPSESIKLQLIVRYLGGPLNQDTAFSLQGSTDNASSNAGFLDFPSAVTAGKGAGEISFVVSQENNTPGFEVITITGGGADYFINFRNYLSTDFGILAGSTVSWEQVYEHVLRFYYVVFPAMSMRIPLNDEGSIRATAPQILARLSADFHSTTLRMPITRSMSPSQTRLLVAFLKGAPWVPLENANV